MVGAVRIDVVAEADLGDLLPLIDGYLAFYGVDPPAQDVRAMCRALIADPRGEGLQLIARDEGCQPLGFATIFFTWSTLAAARIAVMNDLFVAEDARGSGAADALIAACIDHCRARGDIAELGWQTAKDNLRAQAVYERSGASRSEWLDYTIPTR